MWKPRQLEEESFFKALIKRSMKDEHVMMAAAMRVFMYLRHCMETKSTTNVWPDLRDMVSTHAVPEC